jgi:hypothetical protein
MNVNQHHARSVTLVGQKFTIANHLKAMAQAVSGRPPTAVARVRSRVSMWVFWGTKGHGDRVPPPPPPSTSVFP